MNKILKTTSIILVKLWGFSEKKRKIQFLSLSFFIIVVAIFEMISIGSVIPFVGAISNPEYMFSHRYLSGFIKFFNFKTADEIIVPLTCTFICLAITSAIFRIYLLKLSTQFAFLYANDLNKIIFERIIRQPYEQYSTQNRGEIIAGITIKTNAITQALTIPLINIFSSSVLLLAIFFTMLFINFLAAIIIFTSFIFLYFFVISVVKKKLDENSKILSKESVNVVNNLHDGIGAYRDIVLNNQHDLYSKGFAKSDLNFRLAQCSNIIIRQIPRYWIEAFGIITLALITLILLKINKNMDVVLPIIAGFALGAQRGLPLAQQVYASIVSYLGSIDPIKDALKLIDVQDLHQVSENVKTDLNYSNTIKFVDVSFKYKNEQNYVFENISFEFRKDQKIGIIGTTGVGKSTIVDLISGLLKPTKGKILIDDIDLNSFNLSSWQKKISHVPQTIFLKDGTIEENIALGHESNKINTTKILDSIKIACLDRAISSFPKKLKTRVGDNGIKLSGGQRQRIGLARVIYNLKSDVLILDEATSSLDNNTEKKVINNVMKLGGNLSLIMISHNIESLRYCDKIYELKNKNLNFCGTYDDIKIGQ